VIKHRMGGGKKSMCSRVRNDSKAFLASTRIRYGGCGVRHRGIKDPLGRNRGGQDFYTKGGKCFFMKAGAHGCKGSSTKAKETRYFLKGKTPRKIPGAFLVLRGVFSSKAGGGKSLLGGSPRRRS